MNNPLSLLNNLISFFYPRLCVGCRKSLLKDENLICLRCLTHLPETNYHLYEDNPLKNIFRGRVKTERVMSLLFYKKGNQVQQIIHHLKYKGDKEIGFILGVYYGKELMLLKDFQSIDLILPIPLHPKKEKKRGYNQSEWIAKGLSEGMRIPYFNDILIRSIFTETQTKKERFNRWTNVKNVFQVTRQELIKGKHILICDDVLTTGATMEAAIVQLLKVEGVRVSVLALASAS